MNKRAVNTNFCIGRHQYQRFLRRSRCLPKFLTSSKYANLIQFYIRHFNNFQSVNSTKTIRAFDEKIVQILCHHTQYLAAYLHILIITKYTVLVPTYVLYAHSLRDIYFFKPCEREIRTGRSVNIRRVRIYCSLSLYLFPFLSRCRNH